MDSTNCASTFKCHQGSEYLEINALKKSVEIVFFFYMNKRNYKYKMLCWIMQMWVPGEHEGN